MSKRLFYKKRPWKGLVGGLAGGLAATVMMTQFQNVWSKVAELSSSKEEEESSEKPNSQTEEEQEDATMKAASKLAGIAGYELSREGKKKAGSWVHYGFGTLMGGLYGLGMELSNRRVRRMSPMIPGALFGTGLFLAADEIALPVLKLSEKPSETELGTHAYGLVSHLAYGLALEGFRTVARNLL